MLNMNSKTNYQKNLITHTLAQKMNKIIMSLYITHINGDAKFVARNEFCPDLAKHDPTLNWVLERYLWVSTLPNETK